MTNYDVIWTVEPTEIRYKTLTEIERQLLDALMDKISQDPLAHGVPMPGMPQVRGVTSGAVSVLYEIDPNELVVTVLAVYLG